MGIHLFYLNGLSWSCSAVRENFWAWHQSVDLVEPLHVVFGVAGIQNLMCAIWFQAVPCTQAPGCFHYLSVADELFSSSSPDELALIALYILWASVTLVIFPWSRRVYFEWQDLGGIPGRAAPTKSTNWVLHSQIQAHSAKELQSLIANLLHAKNTDYHNRIHFIYSKLVHTDIWCIQSSPY